MEQIYFSTFQGKQSQNLIKTEAATRGVLKKGVLRNFGKFSGKQLRQV